MNFVNASTFFCGFDFFCFKKDFANTAPFSPQQPLDLHSKRLGEACVLPGPLSLQGSQTMDLDSQATSGAGAAMKEPGRLIWRVDQRSLVVVAGRPGSFHPEDAYVVLMTTRSPMSHSLVSEIFLWLGAATSTVEQGVASVVAVELDEMLGSGWVLHREVQGHESGPFCHVFDNALEYLPARTSEPAPGGSSLLRIDADALVCRTSVVALAAASVRASGVFVLDQGSRLILWPGPASSNRARARAMAVCMRRRERGGGVAEVSVANPNPNPDPSPNPNPGERRGA